MIRLIALFVLLCCLLPHETLGFVLPSRSIAMESSVGLARELWALKDDASFSNDKGTVSRRLLFRNVVSSVVLGTTVVSQKQPARAEDTIWRTGKPPQIPGQKPKDKGDVSGTRKDPSFLRSLSDCKNQCENSVGPDGYAKTKEECLSECQDICCTTYETCTFAIVPRI